MADCKHNWQFTDGSTGTLLCTRCGAVTGPRTPEQLTQDMMQDVLTIGSAWSKGGERIDPMSVYKDFEPWTTAKLTVPTGQLYALDTKPNYNITFHSNLNTLDAGKQVGKLDFNGPELVFEGDAAESAKVFIDLVARTFHGRLKEEREAGRQEAEAELDATNRQVEILSDALAESRQEMQGRIDTLHAMYEQASRQRDELMDQQRAQVAAMRGRIQ